MVLRGILTAACRSHKDSQRIMHNSPQFTPIHSLVWKGACWLVEREPCYNVRITRRLMTCELYTHVRTACSVLQLTLGCLTAPCHSFPFPPLGKLYDHLPLHGYHLSTYLWQYTRGRIVASEVSACLTSSWSYTLHVAALLPSPWS